MFPVLFDKYRAKPLLEICNTHSHITQTTGTDESYGEMIITKVRENTNRKYEHVRYSKLQKEGEGGEVEKLNTVTISQTNSRESLPF